MKKLLKGLIVLLLIVFVFPQNVYASGSLGTHAVTGEQVGNDLHLFSEDDPFLSLLVETGKVSFEFNPLRPNKKVYHVFSGDDLEKTQNYVIVKNVSQYILPSNGNGSPTCCLYIGNELTDTPYVSIQNSQIQRKPVPSDVSFVFENKQFIISSEDTEYIEDINIAVVSQYYEPSYGGSALYEKRLTYTYGDSNSHISDDGTKVTIDLGDDPQLTNGTASISVNSYYYENYSNNITISGIEKEQCPIFDTSINNVGDLIITSDDEDWIDALSSIVPSRLYDDASFSYGPKTIMALYKETGEYSNVHFFGVNNQEKQSGENTIIKVDGKTAKIKAEVLTNAGCISGFEYHVVFNAYGYEASTPVHLSFPKCIQIIPNDIEVSIVNGEALIIKTSDTDFINDISSRERYVQGITAYHGGPDKVIKLVDGELQNTIGEKIEDRYPNHKIDDNTLIYDASQIPTSCYQGTLYFTIYNLRNSRYTDLEHYTEKTISYGQVTISFDNNGGSGLMNDVQAGGYYQLPANGFTAPFGKEYHGWQVGDDSTVRFEKEKVLIFSDKTIKAIWHDLPTPTTTVNDSQIEEGQVTKITPIENSTKSSLGGSVENLISAADKAAGAAVWMETKPIDNTSDDYTRMQRGFALEHSGDLMECMEINIFKKVKGQEAEKVSKTLEKATISFDLSDKPALMELAFNNQLFVYSIHNGKVSDLIVGTYNPTTHIYTFQADEFSVFGFFKQGDPNPNQGGESDSGSGTNTIGYRFTNTGIK